MSPELKAALEAWLKDATSARPSSDVMQFGLCSYVAWRASNYEKRELRDMLVEEFGEDNYCFPFGEGAYSEDGRNYQQHKNPRRLAWVRAKLEEAA